MMNNALVPREAYASVNWCQKGHLLGLRDGDSAFFLRSWTEPSGCRDAVYVEQPSSSPKKPHFSRLCTVVAVKPGASDYSSLD